MPKDHVALAQKQPGFYRANYVKLIYICMFLLLLNGLVIGLIFYKHLSIKQPPYFATTADGRLVEIKPKK